MRRAPQPLHRIIANDETLAGWQARHAREQTLTALVRRQLPRQLGNLVRVQESASGELELLTTAGAVAAAVRQRLPDVAAALRRDGHEVSGLRVRVRVAVGGVEAAREPRVALDHAAAAPLADLARRLPPGPLQSAVRRLLRRSGTG